MKYECILGININGYRIRVGDIISDSDPKTAMFMPIAEERSKPRMVNGKAITTINFVVVDGSKKVEVDEPMTITDIARSRQYNPAAKRK